MIARALGMCLCEREGVCVREWVGIPYFRCDFTAPPRPQWGSSPRPFFVFPTGQGREQAPSKVRHWFLERGDSLNEEAIPGQAVFCPHVP